MEGVNFDCEEGGEENYNCGLFYEDYDDENSDEDVRFVEGIQDVIIDSSSSSRSPLCQVITRDSLLIAQGEILQRVMDLLMVTVHHARTLLIHYHWNVDKLVTVLVEKGKDHLFAEAGVKMVQCCSELDLNLRVSSTLFCYVCMEDVRCHEATQMDCEHSFCNNCWTEHFVQQIKDGHSRRIRCMAHNCDTICDEVVIRNLVSKRDQDLAEKFDRFLLDSYIEENKMVKWCPSVPHCGNAIRVENVLCEVGCTCGLQFCFSCLSEAHSPCSCLMWELWRKRWKDENETTKWIQVNTKNCPSCYKPVEKNGGCNIVRCLCGKPFCWVCLQAKGHNHQCGRYEDPGDSTKLARISLYRYKHYFDRFKAHRDSLKLETELEQTVRIKISFSEEEKELQEIGWLEKGMSLLFRSRKILSYSYAFAFYMFGDELFKDYMNKKEMKIKQNLFEDQQQQFEANVEKLSRLIEEPIHKYTVDEIKDLKSKVIILSHVVRDFSKRMYECIENDLLGWLPCNNHNIAPYRADGVEKASELSASLSTMGTAGVPSEDEINGWMMEIDESSSFKKPSKKLRIR